MIPTPLHPDAGIALLFPLTSVFVDPWTPLLPIRGTWVPRRGVLVAHPPWDDVEPSILWPKMASTEQSDLASGLAWITIGPNADIAKTYAAKKSLTNG
ncbi:hypothetical protein O1611_g8170 [Lasiodiplodia mahajangana]|uniref:Uncharacterized protein n=1 Tax=Lasiodiplodia mahajangana TaxID=1108764 RepID=A0ACC2JDL7_9PEZI|nr:hypothetical protein O1611_g8170 [Lasiodiplodia mahajangana]